MQGATSGSAARQAMWPEARDHSTCNILSENMTHQQDLHHCAATGYSAEGDGEGGVFRMENGKNFSFSANLGNAG